MAQVNWMPAELSKHFTNLDLMVGVDLDRNNTIAGSEITDQDHDGVISDPEWQQFAVDNQAALEKLGGKFKAHYSEDKPDFLVRAADVASNIFLGLLTVAAAPFGVMGCSSSLDRELDVDTDIAWTEHKISGDTYEPRPAHAVDMDGDGDLDVLGASKTSDDIAWWENVVGDGLIWVGHTVDEDFWGGGSVYTADVDNDDETSFLDPGSLL